MPLCHYAFLPETELHEALNSFLFDLRKRPHEGATAFASRFKTALRRVQALIAQEPSTAKNKKRKSKVSVASAEPDNSSKELSDEGSEPKSISPGRPTAAPASTSAEASGQAAGSVPPETPAPTSAASPPIYTFLYTDIDAFSFSLFINF